MTKKSKFWRSITLGVIGAAAILGTALWTKRVGGDLNAWLYVFCVWIIVMAAFESYSNYLIHKNRK